MIPRLKPYLTMQELFALVQSSDDAVCQFEKKFAATFNSSYAIAYPYGRSALWAFFKTLGIRDAEIIMPAYTCSVVGHAVVLSDNIPCFVDCSLTDYNMLLTDIEQAITPKTRAIIATHIFGYPMDMAALRSIISAAETRYGHKIWLISDCAHSFGAEYNGMSVVTGGDIALFGLNISKTITSIFGGMLTTNDDDLAQKLRQWRDQNYSQPNTTKSLRRRLYLTAIYGAFQNQIYGFVYWLQNSTTLLTQLTDSYHLDEKIHFPPDYLDKLTSVEARVGIQQLDKYETIIAKRRRNAQFYCEHLSDLTNDNFVLPPLVDGATYSHFVIRVKDRKQWIDAMASLNIQLGILIEYNMADLSAYQPYVHQAYPNSRYCSTHMINLPIHANLSEKQLVRIVENVKTTEAHI